ncbi:MAG: crossover junction endodeoxyribonuclease RuvC [Candidatus Omnitrophota bacterium]|jgi:crossover junction endodeoxyribonuclease RuvC|nr:crossover junction endodeoxyribonuclease RuvC [Candidatus Omnitrophota bacterium]MDD5518001.1 crossover junction endodeoxyribonuclease RuvC [Candidatus Omnitrophota bacterium]
MKILGIDPALTITGYGLIQARGNKLCLVEAGIISTCAKEVITRRLDKIYRCIVKLISDTSPDVLVLEKIYAHYRHPATAYILGQARGVICLACATKNIPLAEYAATRVKKAVVGEGLASKAQVQKMVAGLLGLESLPKYTDITDALALAIAHSYIVRPKI